MKQVKVFFMGLVLLLLAGPAWADITVNGNVTDKALGEPVIGASVLEKGTTNGTITDFDGNFVLTVKDGAELEVSYVGYSSQTILAAPQVNILLAEDAEVLEEVVITGYQVQRKADMTGAVSVVATDDLSKNINQTDPVAGLQGKIAGVTIRPSGSPAESASITIRGGGKISNSTSSPLYVIDGVPTLTGLNSLNPSDIESMQVLKDAASASIYGSRAANGVIVITTKKGKKNDKINVDLNIGLTAQIYSGQSKMKLLDTPGYATAMVQAALNDGKDIHTYARNYGVGLYPVGSAIDGGFPIHVYNPATGAFEDYVAAGAFGGGKYINDKQTMPFSNTNWLDEISRTGLTQSYDLSISRANDKSSQLFSFAYKKADGILKHTEYENLTARVNTSFNIAKWLTVGENVSFSYSNDVNCYPMENALKIASIIPVYEIDTETGAWRDGSNGKAPQFGGPVCGMSDRQNPMRELYYNKDNMGKRWRIFGNAFVNITPVKGLLIRSNIGVEYENFRLRMIKKSWDSDVLHSLDTYATQESRNSFAYTWSNTAQYSCDLGKEQTHHLTGLVGLELHGDQYDQHWGKREDYSVENYDYMWLDSGTGKMFVTGKGEASRLVSFFEKVDYNWDDRILASFTIRHDGSSRFGENNKFGHFPSAQLGYRLSRDLELNWLDDFKFRGSWGINGNQDIWNTARFGIYAENYGPNRETATAYEVAPGVFQGGYIATQPANPNLKWESTYQGNAGIDFAFLHNSLYGTIDWYQKDVKDMLVRCAGLGAVGEGVDARWTNGPSQRIRGMEFVLGYRKLTHSGVSIDIMGNLDFYRSRVTYLPEAQKNSYTHTVDEDYVTSGQPWGSRIGYVADGLFQTQEEVLASGQNTARLGGLKFVDLNGDGRIDEKDQTWIFSPEPKASWGLNFELGYKGLEFTMFWQGVAGVQVWNDQKFQTDFWSTTDPGSSKGARCLDAWTLANTTSTIPALTTGNDDSGKAASSYYVENGSYAKLRKLQLGYSFQKKELEKMHMEHARLYFAADNIATIKSKSLTCTDPENGGYAYPLPTSFSFGMQFGF
ncbi:MAG: TonB-dependent receptor [Paludibacteraceae bacterium]|nr:TonB-dependent receptor [Paludibacteraceae bacterium]